LQESIDAVRQSEQIFLDALGAKDITEVNQRLANIKSKAGFISNLSGMGLKERFLDGLQASYDAKLQKE
jgi:hypothetical protein